MAISQGGTQEPSNWLISSLAPEPDLGALEDLYRKEMFPADAMQLKHIAWISYFVVLFFAWNDYQILGLSLKLAMVYLVRVCVVSLTWLMLVRVPAIVKSYLALDRVVLAWGLVMAMYVLFIDSTRPSTFFYNAPLNVLMIIVLHTTIPNRYTYRLIQAVTFTGASLFIFAIFRTEVGSIGFRSLITSFLFANYLGWITSTWMHKLRRNQFLARHREHTARLEIERLAMIDQLTQVYNRRRFMELAEAELERFQRYGHRFCVMYLDLDNFKQINDTLGHSTGDVVLKQFAAMIIDQIRQNDLVGRLGGDEFAVLVPETGLDQAQEMAERICCRCSGLVVQTPTRQLDVTVCIGLTEVRTGDMLMDELLHRADQALYDAKVLGGNRVAVRNSIDQ